MKTRFEWLLILAAASVAFCADSKLQVPVMGFVARSSPITVQPILGVPGSVVLGPAIALPEGVSKLAIAPGQAFGLTEAADANEARLITLTSESASSPQAISGAFAHWDRIAFSGSGGWAVLYSGASKQAQVVSGLPSQAAVDRTVDLSSLGDVPLTAIAVSDDGQSVLAGQSDGTSGAIWLYAAGKDPRKLSNAGSPSMLKFLPGSQDVLVADQALKQVLVLSGSDLRVVAGEAQGLTAPVDMEMSADRKQVWIADGAGLFSVQLDSSTVSFQATPYAPASLNRSSAKTVFLLLGQDGDSSGLWAPESSSKQVWQFPGSKVE